MTSRACRRIRSSLVRYLDAETKPAGRNVIESHLDRCADCRAELDRLRGFKALWSSQSDLRPEEWSLRSTAEDRSAIVRAAREALRNARAPLSIRLERWLLDRRGLSVRIGRGNLRFRLADLVTAGAVAGSCLMVAQMIHSEHRIDRLPRSSVALSIEEIRLEGKEPDRAPLEIGDPR